MKYSMRIIILSISIFIQAAALTYIIGVRILHSRVGLEFVNSTDSIRYPTTQNEPKSTYDACLILDSTGIGEIRLGRKLCYIPEKGAFYNNMSYYTAYYDGEGTSNEVCLRQNSEVVGRLKINDDEQICAIDIYTHKVHTPDGIHVGMTARELVKNYGAEIYMNNEHWSYLTFYFPDYPAKSFRYVGEANSYCENNFTEWGENIIPLTSGNSNCRLTCISL